MMDYCARESTIESYGDTCEQEQTTAEIVRSIRKELGETISVLCGLRLSIEGEEATERKAEEPKCFHEEVKLLERMALDCMGLAHVIADRLFGTFH